MTELLASTGARIGTYAVFDPVSQTSSAPYGIVFDGVNIWVNSFNTSALWKIVAATGEVLGSYPTKYGSVGLAFDGKYIYSASFSYGVVSKVLASTGELVQTIPVPSSLPFGLAFDETSIWAGMQQGSYVLKIRQ